MLQISFLGFRHTVFLIDWFKTRHCFDLRDGTCLHHAASRADFFHKRSATSRQSRKSERDLRSGQRIKEQYQADSATTHVRTKKMKILQNESRGKRDSYMILG
jgi:hypothetical protein